MIKILKWLKNFFKEYKVAFFSFIATLGLLFTASPISEWLQSSVGQILTSVMLITYLSYKYRLVENLLSLYIGIFEKDKRINKGYVYIGIAISLLNMLSSVIFPDKFETAVNIMQAIKIAILIYSVYSIYSEKNKVICSNISQISKSVENMILKNKTNANPTDLNIENRMDDIEEYTKQLEEINKKINELDNAQYGNDNDYDIDEEFYEMQYANSYEVQIEHLYDKKEEIEEKLNTYIYEKNIKNFIKNSEYKNKRIGKVLDDDISEKDLLNRELKAKNTAKYITEINGSFNIGIIGEWGMGKSTFIQMIKRNLLDIENNNDIKIIEYDASAYSEKNQIWANFAKILFQEFEKDKIFSHFMYIYIKIMQNKKKYASRCIINIIMFIITFFVSYIGIRWCFSKKEIEKQIFGYGCSMIGILLLITQIIIPWGRKLLSISIPLSEKIIGRFKFPSYIDVLGTREEVASELDILFKAWCPNKNQKVVIFVDELDRCSEKGIREFFQAIQLFYNTKKVIFVFAIQLSHLEKAIDNSKEIDDTNSVKQYLDKYVSILVKLDNENKKISEYALNLIREINAKNKLQIEENEISNIAKCLDIIPKSNLTPRKIKKLVNLLVLSKSFSIYKYREERINYSELFTWIIMYNFETKTSNYIYSLYKDTEAHSTVKNIMRNKSYEKNLEEILCNKEFIKLVEEFRMCDVIRYNSIAQEFAILS